MHARSSLEAKGWARDGRMCIVLMALQGCLGQGKRSSGTGDGVGPLSRHGRMFGGECLAGLDACPVLFGGQGMGTGWADVHSPHGSSGLSRSGHEV